jgi:ribosomal-protein-alanine N-acetyltransferase
MKIRRAEAGDLPSILAVENNCFSRDVAFPPEITTFLLEEATALVAEDGTVAGFIIGFVSGEWGKVVTLDVLPERRGEGLGRGLMEALEEEMTSQGAGASLLEVAVENRGALSLYSKLGYVKAAILEDYYGPGEDALLMMKRLRRARHSSSED